MVDSKASRRSVQKGDQFKAGLGAQESLQRGLALVERVLGPTLGPLGTPVLVARIGRPNEPPEVLSDAGILALRLTGIPEPCANVGLMLNRQVAWKLRSEMGDGSATASVICAATHRGLLTATTAGADPRRLRSGVEHAVELVSRAITASARPLSSGEAERFVAASSGDPRLVPVVTEAIALLGPDAVITVRDSPRDTPELQIVEGALWESGLVSSQFGDGGMGEDLVLDRPRVLIWDEKLEDAAPLIDTLECLRWNGVRSLLLVARTVGPAVMALLAANNKPDFRLAAVNAPYEGNNLEWALADLAALTGARVLAPERGDTLKRLDMGAVGRAQRAIVGRGFFNVFPLDAASEAVARQVASVRYRLSESENESERGALWSRLGRLAGGMGVVWVGGHNEEERLQRRRATERTVAGLRAAVDGGVVPGAGATYLAVARCLSGSTTHDEDLGVAAVAAALTAPARWIARNAGLDPIAAVAEARAVAPDQGIDGVTGTLVHLRSAGIVDPALTLIRAVSVGATAAAMAITGEVLVVRPYLRITSADIRP